MSRLLLSFAVAVLLLGTGCSSPTPPSASSSESASPAAAYTSVRLTPELGPLSDAQVNKTIHLIEAVQAMDAIFWEQAYGNRDSLLQTLSDSLQRRAVRLNYGPWDRLRDGTPIVDGVGPRPPGANFYPADGTLDTTNMPDTLRTPHTMVRRLPDGSLTALPYHLFFAEAMTSAALSMRDAARLAASDALSTYLERRAEALVQGRYASSNAAWHALEAPAVDVLIGPMNTGEDRLLGVKDAAAGGVLHRNEKKSQHLARLLAPLSDRRAAIGLDALVPPRPVPTQRWGAYDALYVTGGLNTGPKATVLPLSPTGPRRLLLTNVIRARATALLAPTARHGLVDAQRAAVTPEALFAHTALRTWSRASVAGSPSDDTSAAILDAAVATATALTLAPEVDAQAHYATAVADLVHTVRVDAASQRGRAAAFLLHAMQDAGALSPDPSSGLYAVMPDTMAQILPALVRQLHGGRTDPQTAASLLDRYGSPPAALMATLDRLNAAEVPRALAFDQGASGLRSTAPTASRKDEPIVQTVQGDRSDRFGCALPRCSQGPGAGRSGGDAPYSRPS